MNSIVKRAGHTEDYDERKLYASVYASCIAVKVPQGEAELVAGQVCSDVKDWLSGKEEVTSGDIHRAAAKNLCAYNADAGYIYETHREIS